MTEKTVFVYRLEQPSLEQDRVTGDGLQFRIWRPGIVSYIPPNSPVSYLFLWIMHVLKIFKNRDYAAYSIIEKGRSVCSLVSVPALYKWPFMSPDDLQIKNVFTHKEYRGKGYASRLIQHTLRQTSNPDRVYWYMTDEGNIPSQKLCGKIGFEYMGKYRRKRSRYFLYE